MAALARVLADGRVPKGGQGQKGPVPTTHTSMGDPFRGSFSFPEGSACRERLLDAYALDVDAGRPVSLVERHTPTGPVIVDINLRLSGPERTYTEEHLANFVNALVSATIFFVLQTTIEVVVLEKPAPRPAGSKEGVFKDGWHVVLPNVVTHPAVQLAIRDHFVADVTADRRFASTVADLPGLTVRDPDAIYDRTVIESGGWFLLGSKKPDEAHAWAVTQWYEIDVASMRVTLRDVERMSTRERVETLSIRVSPEGHHSPYTRHGREVVGMARRAPESREGGGGRDGFMACDDVEVRHLQQLVDMLDAGRARDYLSWMRVGWALSNTEDVGSREQRLGVWMAFGRRCPDKFDAAEHARIWANMAPRAGSGAVGVGTLRYMANEDSPEAYREWTKALATRSVTRALDVGQIDRAKIMEQLRSQLEGVDLQSDVLEVIDRAIRFKAADGKNGSIHKDKYIVQLEDAFYGSLVKEFPITKDLGCIRDNRFPSGGGPYNCKLLSSDGKSVSSAIIRGSSSQGDIEVKLLDMHDASESYIYMRRGDDRAVKIHNQKVVAQLMKMVFEGQDLCAAQQFGITQNIFINNGTIINGAAQPKTRAAYDYIGDLRGSGFYERVVALAHNKYYFYDDRESLWKLGGVEDAAAMLREMVSLGQVPNLTDAETEYLKGCQGPILVIKSIFKTMEVPKFSKQLDRIPLHCLPFDNGMYDASSGAFRDIVQQDYLTAKMDYPYSGVVDQAEIDEVASFYAKVFPDTVERDYFQKMIAAALFGRGNHKHFLVLTDSRDGSNGKSNVMRAISGVFDIFNGKTERDFLTVSSMANPNAHAANLLAYEGKRLAFFDEPSRNKRIDIDKLKELSSSVSELSGRGIHKGNVDSFTFRALIVIACNENNFPAMDASDGAFLRRVKGLRMRSLFVNSADMHKFAEEDNVFEMDANIKERMDELKVAHIHILADAYRRWLDVELRPEPPVVGEVVKSIMEYADARIPDVVDWIRANVEFLEEKRGQPFLIESVLLKQMWAEIGDQLMRVHGREFKRPQYKPLLRRAMEMCGRKSMIPGRPDNNSVGWSARTMKQTATLDM